MSKPVVTYVGRASVIGGRAYLVPRNHPNDHDLLSNLAPVVTSRVIRHDEETGEIETVNTIYVKEKSIVSTKHNNPFKQIVAFNEAIGKQKGTPQGDNAKLYADLFLEESGETFEALGHLLSAKTEVELLNAVDGVVDGVLDTVVVGIGLLHSMGLDVGPLWAEIHRSNMDKLKGGPLFREDGKLLKPEGWQPPDLKPIIARQLGFVRKVSKKDLEAQITRKSEAKQSVQEMLKQDTLVENMFSVEQVAAVMNLSTTTIRKAIREGKLRHKYYNGNTVRVPESAVVEFQR